MGAQHQALLLGTFDPNFGRNRQIIRLLKRADWEVCIKTVSLWSEERTVDATGRKWLLSIRGIFTSLRIGWLFLLSPKPDVLVVLHPGQFDSLILGPLARLRRVPMVLDLFVSLSETFIDRGLTTTESFKNRVLQWLDRRAMKWATVILVDTPEAVKTFSKVGSIPVSRFHVLWVGADPELYKPQPSTEIVSGRVLFYGTYIPLHGIETIVEAAALLSDEEITIRLLGHGQERKKIEALAYKLASDLAMPLRGKIELQASPISVTSLKEK